MRNQIQYRSLFAVDMLHDYYLTEDREVYHQDDNLRREWLAIQRRDYQLSRDLAIRPTPDCTQALKNNRLLFKPTNRGFFVGAQVRQIDGLPAGSFTPFIALEQPFRLRFAVTLNNPHFHNFTNLRMEKGVQERERYVYYFSNRADNTVSLPGGADLHYMSLEVPDFRTTVDYEAGEIIINSSGVMLEALEDIQAAVIFDGSQWREIYIGQNPHFQFVTALDRLALRPAIFQHPVANDTEAYQVVIILVRDRDNNLLETHSFQAQDPSNPSATLETCTLDLRNFSPGIYSLEVQQPNGTPIPAFALRFYLDDQLYQQQPLAILECFHEPDGSLGSYRWLDEGNQNQILQPSYQVRWKNRPTWWRYYYEVSPIFTSTDVINLDPTITNPNHRILITAAPKALTQVARRIEIALTGGNTELLPNPGMISIFPEGGRVFSEINMGGGLGPPE